MNDLRKAAEMALKYFEDAHGLEDAEVAIKEALRQALDLQTAIERGTEAWADVPDATEWVEELRGNVNDWVGLTDYEIWDIGVDNQRKGGGFWGYPRAIEAKLKEKNT